MGRVVKPPAEADVADRQIAMGGASEIGMAMFQPALAQILAKAEARLLKQFLDVAGGYMLLFGNMMQCQVAIAELKFDCLGYAMKIAGPR